MSHLLDKIDQRIAATDPSHHEKANVKLLIEARDRLRQLEYEREKAIALIEKSERPFYEACQIIKGGGR